MANENESTPGVIGQTTMNEAEASSDDRLDEMEQSMIYNGYFCPTFTSLEDAGTEEPNHFSFGGYICETVDIARLDLARCHLGLGRAWA
ncbi:hypothetical protein Taro_003289, partial [Colocasia esculenta]|nr:hypothetical protein [Colocasia esculenta]